MAADSTQDESPGRALAGSSVRKGGGPETDRKGGGPPTSVTGSWREITRNGGREKTRKGGGREKTRKGGGREKTGKGGGRGKTWTGGGREKVTASVRVALDVTPLLGVRTGIGNLVAGMHDALVLHAQSTQIVPFAMTARSFYSVAPNQRTFLPARPARAVWEHVDYPPIEWWSGPVDVVHGTNYIVPPARNALRLVSVHDLVALHYPAFCTPDVQRSMVLLKRTLNRGAHVHTDSDFVANEVQEVFRLPAERVHRIYPGIPGFDPTSTGAIAAAETSMHPFGGRPYLLSIGTLEPRKDIALLVRAFGAIASEFSDLYLVVAGQDGLAVAAFESAIQQLPAPLRSRIVRERAVSNTRRDELLRNAEVLVYPSVYEGFGFPPLEALQFGTPVICSRAGSLPEVVGGAASYFAVGSLDELADALRRTLNDSELRSQQVRLGLAVRDRYQWPTMAAELETLYHHLAGRG